MDCHRLESIPYEFEDRLGTLIRYYFPHDGIPEFSTENYLKYEEMREWCTERFGKRLDQMGAWHCEYSGRMFASFWFQNKPAAMEFKLRFS